MTGAMKLFARKILLLMVVTNFSLADDENFEDKLATICRDQVEDFPSVYQKDVRKCFVAGTEPMTWNEAKATCKRLPRLDGFNKPTLVAVDYNSEQMETLLNDKLVRLHSVKQADFCHYWTGGYISFVFVGDKVKHNDQWRWDADRSRLRSDDKIWARNKPTDNLDRVCAVYALSCGGSVEDSGLSDQQCGRWMDQDSIDAPMLCQYEASESQS